MKYSALPSKDYVEIDDPAYAAFHLDKASGLFRILRDNSRMYKQSAAKISENMDLLYTKIMMGIADSIKFDLRSGFPLKYEFIQVSVEQDIVDEKIKNNYSPEIIRDNIISGIDSLQLENFREKAGETIAENMESLARYNYNMKLLKNRSYHDISINARIIEDGKPSLAGVNMFGFSPVLNSFVEHNIELYDTPGIFKSKKFRKLDYDSANISQKVSNHMRILFARESNILFYELSKEGNLRVRKSERKVFGPLYSPITTDSEAYSRVDPQNKIMAEIARESAVLILSVHRDCSTEYYDSEDYDNEEKPDQEKMIKNPFIEISHKYVADKNIVDIVADIVPKHDIITAKEK